jgi:diguanylate cyclase (GGDEF)-like protein
VEKQSTVQSARSFDELGARRRACAVRSRAAAASASGRARSNYYAWHDRLTNLRNRPYLMAALARSIERARVDPGYGFALIAIDLDRFRAVNERFDYDSGDLVLRTVAARLERCTRAHDTLARTGGDEFTLLVEASRAGIASVTVAIARRIETEFRQPLRVRESDVLLRASVGIATWAERYGDGNALMRNADTAMRLGRGDKHLRYLVFSDTMHEQEAAATQLESELCSALERKELRVYYQPLVDVAAARIYGFEALVRWQHPERGLVSAAEFIPLAEDTGLILSIGEWVLQEAACRARDRQKLTSEPLLMSVNVSSRQLQDPRFLPILQHALRVSEIDPASLQLEITESVFLPGALIHGAILERIRDLGVRIALDDFGTGFSSLGYLERHQIDSLKIDQSFVARIDDMSAKSEIVRMIISLAHALGVQLIAEGVETATQSTALIALGCTHFQGYFFNRPLSEADVVRGFATRWERHAELATLLEGPPVQYGPSLSLAEKRELYEQVTQAIERHFLWKRHLKDAIDTGASDLTPDVVAREDVCPIGIWLSSSISEELKRTPLYSVTVARHAVFHRGAARLLALALARDPAAHRSFSKGGDFAMIAETLHKALEDWLAVSGS